MTIKNITLSAVAVAMLSSVVSAGTIKNASGAGLVGSEKLSISDVNVTAAFRTVGSVVYTPTNIPATSLKNPIFKYTFGGGTGLVVDTNTSIWEGPIDGNETNTTLGNWRRVAGDMQISGTNNEVASFNAVDSSIYVYNNKHYVVADNTGGNITDANVSLVMKKASTRNLELQAELYSGDSQAQADLAPATVIAKIAKEFIGSVTQKFNNTIDASLAFAKFHDFGSAPESATVDRAIFNIHQNKTLPGASLGATAADLEVFFDQNTSKYITGKAFLSSTGLVAPQLTNDMNATTGLNGFNAAGAAAVDTNTSLTLTVPGTAEIKKTLFGARAYVKSGSNVFDIISKSADNAGAWTIYGYNAQIPNVASTSTVDVTMKFTNRSTLDTDIYFTMIDPDGTVATLTSKDVTSLTKMKANTTGTYKASQLVSLIKDGTAKIDDTNSATPGFDTDGSFSVEVSIPTTPTTVYGMASFKNLTLGQFKDLPVYNNGNNY